MRFDADFSVTGWLTSAAFCMTTLSVVDVGVVDLDPAGLGVDEHVDAVGLGGRPDGVEVP